MILESISSIYWRKYNHYLENISAPLYKKWSQPKFIDTKVDKNYSIYNQVQ